MIAPKLVVKNLASFSRELQAGDRKRVKAAQTAVRVEAFRLMKVLKQEIRQGAPGGKPFAPLSEIAKRTGSRPFGRKPLKRMAIPVRYWSSRSGANFVASVGYQGDTITNAAGQFATLSDGVTPSSRSRTSASWLYLAKVVQQGGQHPVTERQRQYFRHIGAGLKKGRNRQLAKFFFIRRERTQFNARPRPIIDPFWASHQAQAMGNIRNNFNRKMAGERI